jgi:hypothetical protein
LEHSHQANSQKYHQHISASDPGRRAQQTDRQQESVLDRRGTVDRKEGATRFTEIVLHI